MNDEFITQIINDFLETKPETITVIGYGSAVKKQNRDKNIIKKQIDIIIGVKDPKKWHKENKLRNPNDYTFMGYNVLTKLPTSITNYGTNINYLAYLTHKNFQFKIGVIKNTDLINDLNNWENGYMAGRMQKSVKVIKGSKEIRDAIKRNRENALRVSLLLLDTNNLTIEGLHQKICSLSYDGDIRMRFKMENPNKVIDIAKGSKEELTEIYTSVNNGYYTVDKNDNITINYDKIISTYEDFPKNLKEKIHEPKSTKKEDLLKVREEINKYIHKNNLKTSIAQPLKGIATNGISKSFTYAVNKRRKHNIYK